VASPPVTQPTFGAAPPFAPRPQPSALSATPILTQQIDAEEPEVIRYLFFLLPTPACAYFFDRQWRERQADEIKARDERSKARRQETISKAERSIDQFYEEYTGKRERQIRENKCVLSPSRKSVLLIISKSEIRRLSMLHPRLMHCHTGRHGIVLATLSNSKIRKAKHSRALDLERQNSLDFVRCFCACGAKARAHQARRDTEPRGLLHFSLEQ
jgi:hypothetical protein